MHQHLRLARERGSLTVPNSRVQDRGLEYLMMLDLRATAQARTDFVKGLLTSQMSSLEAVQYQFPEYFADPDPFEGARTADGEYDPELIDEDAIEWSTAGSEEEDQAISDWIAQQESGSFTGSEM